MIVKVLNQREKSITFDWDELIWVHVSWIPFKVLGEGINNESYFFLD